MDGNLQFTTDPETGDVLYSTPNPEPAPSDDLYEGMPLDARDRLVEVLTENIAFDEANRADREKMHADFVELLGTGAQSDPDDSEEAADRSDHPLLLTALTRFQAKALSGLLPSDDMAVRFKPAIDLDAIEDPDEREALTLLVNEAGERVSQFYTEYLFERLPSYEEDTDTLLYDMGLFGTGIRKITKDSSDLYTPVKSEHVPLEDLIISYDTRSLRRGRYTHRIDMPAETLVRKFASGQYRPIKVHHGGADEKAGLTQARDDMYGLGSLHDTETHRIYEVYTDLYLPNDAHPKKHARPYIVTIHAASREILAIQRNWRENDPAEVPIEHFVAYLYHPGKNATTGVGLGDLLANTTRSLRQAQRRAFESAYLQNHPSGFKLKSFSILNEASRVERGEFIDVESPTQDIRSAIMPHPFQGPSPALLTLGEKLEQNGRELGGIASLDFTELMKAGIAAGPAMAAFEESSEFQSAVHRRLYKAHRKELKLIHDRMRECYGNKTVVFNDGQSTLQPEDLLLVDIIPYMKPGQVSRQKQIMEAQAVLELTNARPNDLDGRKALEQYLAALGMTNIDEILLPDPEEAEVEPADPATEYAAILRGAPVRAGPAQDHQAHITAHAMQMKLLNTSMLPVEQGDMVMAAMSAHIAEHMGLQMIMGVAGQLGVAPEQLAQAEAQLAPQIAMAVQQLAEQMLPSEDAPEDTRLAAAQINAEKDLTKEQMRQRHEREMLELKQRHEKEIQADKDRAAMDRALQDDRTALKIAREKGSAATKAGTLSS